MRILSILLSIVMCMATMSCVKEEVASTGDIYGVVKDMSTSVTLQGCAVTINPLGRTTTTGADGRYEFKELPPETYSVEFMKEGYEPERKNVVVIAGEAATVDVLMAKQGMKLLLSQESLDFGDLESSKDMIISLPGNNSVSVGIRENSSWLKVSPESGTVTKSGLKLTVLVDRQSLAVGDYAGSFSITSALGETIVPVRMKVAQDAAPEISNSGDFYDIDETSFKINGIIKSTGGAVVTRYGHCWAEKTNPTVNDYTTNLGTTKEVGEFTSIVNGLTSGKTYYVRAYAENKNGISYSDNLVITMPKSSPHDDTKKWDGTVAKSFEGGTGTIADPYLIATPQQLAYIEKSGKKDSHFKLVKDIDLDFISWTPIGNFEGFFDGNGKTIFNLKVETATNGGLLGISSFSNELEVKNLTISGIKMSHEDGSQYGALIGYACFCKVYIDNCHIILNENSIINGASSVGGLIGVASSSASITIKNSSVSSSNSTISIAGKENVGGLIGNASIDHYGPIMISNCIVKTVIGGDKNVGGLIGCLISTKNEVNINDSSYEGELKGSGSHDSLIGFYGINTRDNVTLTNCTYNGKKVTE